MSLLLTCVTSFCVWDALSYIHFAYNVAPTAREVFFQLFNYYSLFYIFICWLAYNFKNTQGGAQLGNCYECAAHDDTLSGESQKSTYHRCKICIKPTHNGQKLSHFEGKLPFFTPSGGKISKKVPMIGAEMLKKAPSIGANFFKNPPIRAVHP